MMMMNQSFATTTSTADRQSPLAVLILIPGQLCGAKRDELPRLLCDLHSFEEVCFVPYVLAKPCNRLQTTTYSVSRVPPRLGLWPNLPVAFFSAASPAHTAAASPQPPRQSNAPPLLKHSNSKM
jgi:hypothetical protein